MLTMLTQLQGRCARELQRLVDHAARKAERAGALGQRADRLRERLARIAQRKIRLISFYHVLLKESQAHANHAKEEIENCDTELLETQRELSEVDEERLVKEAHIEELQIQIGLWRNVLRWVGSRARAPSA